MNALQKDAKRAWYKPQQIDGYASSFLSSDRSNLTPICAPKCETIFTRALRCLLIVCMVLVKSTDAMEKQPSAYGFLEKKATTIESQNKMSGWGYIVGGGAALAISIPGYYLSEDVFARAIYGVGETLGVGGIGYGAYLVLLEGDYARFSKMISSVPELSVELRDKLARRFLEENAERSRNIRKLRAISHSLMGGINILNAITTEQRELRMALFFLGGVNTLVTLSCILWRSEKEKLLESVPSLMAEIQIGTGVAMKLNF